jgi:transcriptional regulator of acetoin/glycerol metabolism
MSPEAAYRLALTTLSAEDRETTRAVVETKGDISAAARKLRMSCSTIYGRFGRATQNLRATMERQDTLKLIVQMVR